MINNLNKFKWENWNFKQTRKGWIKSATTGKICWYSKNIFSKITKKNKDVYRKSASLYNVNHLKRKRDAKDKEVKKAVCELFEEIKKPHPTSLKQKDISVYIINNKQHQITT